MIFLVEPLAIFDLLNGFVISPDFKSFSSAAGVCDQFCGSICSTYGNCSGHCQNWKSCSL